MYTGICTHVVCKLVRSLAQLACENRTQFIGASAHNLVVYIDMVWCAIEACTCHFSAVRLLTPHPAQVFVWASQQIIDRTCSKSLFSGRNSSTTLHGREECERLRWRRGVRSVKGEDGRGGEVRNESVRSVKGEGRRGEVWRSEECGR